MAEEKRPVGAKPTNDVAGQVAERVRGGDNVLIALSRDPSVDELSAAIGLTFLLDKMGKHATAIFSGAVPNAIEFLEPEKTFETNTNSLQDFIIALDKNKADHLRYKIDGDFVKVYITPYKTTINEGDLEFSHGDYNVDLVIALGVESAGDLDNALAEHGRIMHDASSINIGVEAPGKFGDLQWSDPAASSVSEMICELAERLKDKEVLMDTPIATALLAGIVAATNRFSNERTTPATMNVASRLMEAGADQQLISSSIQVDGVMEAADAGTGMSTEVVEAESEKSAEEPALMGEVDPSRLQVQRDEPEVVDDGVKVEAAAQTVPEMPAPVANLVESQTPEQQLEAVVQAPVGGADGAGPLMDELREAAEQEAALEPDHEKVLEPLGDGVQNDQKDYASMMAQELGEVPGAVAPDAAAGVVPAGGAVPVEVAAVPVSDNGAVAPVPVDAGGVLAEGAGAPVVENVSAPVAAVTENVATQAAPVVPSTVEINGIPAIDYGQASDAGVSMSAPSMNTGSVVSGGGEVQDAQVVAPVIAAEAVPAPVVSGAASVPVVAGGVASASVVTPLPMPNVSSEFLPPPPPPFDPDTAMGAVDFAPPALVAAAPAAEPIAPAVPEAPAEGERSYLGKTPVMTDQVYPAQAEDPGAFKLPGSPN